MYIIHSYDNNPQYDMYIIYIYIYIFIVIKNVYAYYSNPQFDIR